MREIRQSGLAGGGTQLNASFLPRSICWGIATQRALRDAGAEPVGPISTIAQAEELVASQRLDAAVLDLNLHGEMASDFVQKLSQSELPCLIVSGYGEDAIPDCVAGMARLEKPVSPSVVVDSLAAELSRVRVS